MKHHHVKVGGALGVMICKWWPVIALLCCKFNAGIYWQSAWSFISKISSSTAAWDSLVKFTKKQWQNTLFLCCTSEAQFPKKGAIQLHTPNLENCQMETHQQIQNTLDNTILLKLGSKDTLEDGMLLLPFKLFSYRQYPGGPVGSAIMFQIRRSLITDETKNGENVRFNFTVELIMRYFNGQKKARNKPSFLSLNVALLQICD